jgi:uncharacterized membrane protein YfcA
MIDLYLAIAAISFLAGLVQGLTGFGSALVAMPLFLLFLDARTAVPLSILNGLIITIYLCLQLKRHLDLGKISPLLLGCLPGIIAGVYFLKSADNTWIKILLGILLVGYASFSLKFKPRAIKMPSLVFRPDQRPGITIPGSQRHTGHKRGVVRLAHLFQDNHGIIYPDHTVPAHWPGSAHDRICDGLSCLKHEGKCVP